MTPPILMPPIVERPLLLYIATTEICLGDLLAQEDSEGNEQVVYYIKRTLTRYEINYTFIEKACLIVVFSTQQLR